MKVGRNDPCPCGSGVKYKKCCIPKYDQAIPQPIRAFEDFGSFTARAWSPKKLMAMSEGDILDKLLHLGIVMNRTDFESEAEGKISVDELVGKWRRLLKTEDVLDEDFIVFAAQELWDRWLPNKLSLHRLEQMLENYLYGENEPKYLERFWKIWTAIRDQILLPYHFRSFEQFAVKYDFPYDMEAVFFDTEGDLINECRKRQEEDSAVWDRLILLYRDMLEHLTEMETSNRLNLQRSIAEAHFYKGDQAGADELFGKLVDHHSDWVWGYIGWGDLYNPKFTEQPAGNKDNALRLYTLGLEKASSDKDVLQERIAELMGG